MSQDQPFRWKSSLCGPLSWVGQSLGISKVGQTVLVRSLESQICHQLAGSIGGGYRKGTMAPAHLHGRHFSFSLCTTGAFQAAIMLELRGSESE